MATNFELLNKKEKCLTPKLEIIKIQHARMDKLDPMILTNLIGSVSFSSLMGRSEPTYTPTKNDHLICNALMEFSLTVLLETLSLRSHYWRVK